MRKTSPCFPRKAVSASRIVARPLIPQACAAAMLAILVFSATSHALDFIKADNQDSLSLNSSWTNGTPPTAGDVAVWDLNVATAFPQTVALGADASWSGIRIADPAGAVRISPGNTLTLGAS